MARLHEVGLRKEHREVDTYIQESVLFAKIFGGADVAEVVDFHGAVGSYPDGATAPTWQFGSGCAGLRTPSPPTRVSVTFGGHGILIPAAGAVIHETEGAFGPGNKASERNWICEKKLPDAVRTQRNELRTALRVSGRRDKET